MIIADQPSFIFIAVPKTGTSSIEKAFRPLQNKPLMRSFNKHSTGMRLSRELPPQRWSSAYKFAFVREPYAWMQSLYRFRQRDALKDPSHAFSMRYTGDISFNEFVSTFSDKELMLKQSDFIATHDGELLVDFLGRYENLQEDYERVCTRLGIPAVTLSRINVSKRGSGENESMSAKSIGIINDYFSRDFEMFGYEKL